MRVESLRGPVVVQPEGDTEVDATINYKYGIRVTSSKKIHY